MLSCYINDQYSDQPLNINNLYIQWYIIQNCRKKFAIKTKSEVMGLDDYLMIWPLVGSIHSLDLYIQIFLVFVKDLNNKVCYILFCYNGDKLEQSCIYFQVHIFHNSSHTWSFLIFKLAPSPLHCQSW